MSHFITAVFSRPGEENADELLAPFNEQDETYMIFQPCEEKPNELQKKYEEVKDEYQYTSFDDFMEQYYGYIKNNNGDWGYMTNPNAKWDWYVEGGRWNGFFRLKDGTRTNMDEVCEIDFGIDQTAYDQSLRFWDVVVGGQPLRKDENENDFVSCWKPEYYIQQYGTRERYAKENASVLPWAFLTPDGDWFEKGEMGWWGMNDATKDSRKTFEEAFNEYVQAHPHDLVTAVDCHI